MQKYDYLIVGAGLYGACIAQNLKKLGKKVLVIDKRNHIAGNIYTKDVGGINVHVYGAHIFHTSDKEVWEYVNQFSEFNNFINSPIAYYKGKYYPLPFNLNTFEALWGISDPELVKSKIEQQAKEENIIEPKNLEEQALSLVGRDVYETLIKGYSEKQWGRKATELPSFIIKRVPVRYYRDNNYFNDMYQGIPIGGYTNLVEKMLDGIEVRLNCDYFDNKNKLDNLAHKIIFTGPIDKYFDYTYGALNYRSLRFEVEDLKVKDYQGNAVINYTEYETPYTRIIEHRFFEFKELDHSVITKEYPDTWDVTKEAYYPINDLNNNEKYNKYLDLAMKQDKVFFGGRLGKYKYFDMDDTIRSALDDLSIILK